VPNAGPYDWKMADADQKNGYAGHAAAYLRAAANHPAVVFYSMHFATPLQRRHEPGYDDGIQGARGKTTRAGHWLSAPRPSSGGWTRPGLSTITPGAIWGRCTLTNFYANFAPAQEMSDWFEHWATTGAKPLFTCEYGVPFSWDWAMFRGWLNGFRYYGGVWVQWEFLPGGVERAVLSATPPSDQRVGKAELATRRGC